MVVVELVVEVEEVEEVVEEVDGFVFRRGTRIVAIVVD